MPKNVSNLPFSGLDNGGMAFISPHTRIGFNFYPQTSNNSFASNRIMEALPVDWEADTQASVLKFSFMKTMGEPSGKWTAIVKQKINPLTGSSYLDLGNQGIMDGDWVDIGVLRNGILIPVCRGIVDTAREQRTTINGADTAVYLLTGRDHGAFFEYPLTYSSLWAHTLGQAVAGFSAGKVEYKIGGRPDELFKILISAAFGRGAVEGQWKLPPSLAEIYNEENLYDLLKVITFSASKGPSDGLRGGYYNEPELWNVGNQTLFQTLSQWTNPLLNEYWCDLLLPGEFLPENGVVSFLTDRDLGQGSLFEGDAFSNVASDNGLGVGLETSKIQSLRSEDKKFGQMAAIIRERPFITTIEGQDSMWFDLPSWDIPRWLVNASDLGWTGEQRVNLFELTSVFGLGSQQEQAAFNKPTWHKEGIATHGLRTHQQRTRFHAQDKAGLAGWISERSDWQRIITDWFAPNPYLRSGSVNMKVLLPEIRIGQKIVLFSEDDLQQQAEQFYCEGVSLEYDGPREPNMPGQGSTTLMLSRGFTGTDAEYYDKMVSMSERFEEIF
jgi:hypothetical protein